MREGNLAAATWALMTFDINAIQRSLHLLSLWGPSEGLQEQPLGCYVSNTSPQTRPAFTCR